MSQRRDVAPGGHVRIIGGRWRGTRLPVADAPGLRPTADRVRETLFNWLQPRLAGARVLDLFAGSGALGLEALSRGGREAVLVESDPQVATALRQVVERLGAQGQAEVVRADAVAWLRAPLHGRFDVVFVDPPFDKELWPAVLASLSPWLAPEALVYLEAPAGAAPMPAGWIVHREGSTREVRYALYRRVPGAAATLAPDPETDGPTTA
ncbi:16S rRNA (guanine(966)-N(2))-methyltransferase RsmD [Cognatiluteimonas profundi]|uniref:16S rRNA (guanine(966)-N(2))-methyltransferase RsmD n=1 Tax=Cognatiluteimonas profundi TaxID=2594501 RepID=UPI00131D3B11|nr:16S rRNA (guanine(966)-N(2))-methyltransferase RsmD [Lysobacter profundi]